AEDGIRDFHVTGVQTCALPICECRAFRRAVILGGSMVARLERWSDLPSRARSLRPADRDLRDHHRLSVRTLWIFGTARLSDSREIGRASCRERVGDAEGGGCLT